MVIVRSVTINLPHLPRSKHIYASVPPMFQPKSPALPALGPPGDRCNIAMTGEKSPCAPHRKANPERRPAVLWVPTKWLAFQQRRYSENIQIHQILKIFLGITWDNFKWALWRIPVSKELTYQSPYSAASCDEKKEPILSFPDIPTRLQAYTEARWGFSQNVWKRPNADSFVSALYSIIP